jgi:hypothetical protein
VLIALGIRQGDLKELMITKDRPQLPFNRDAILLVRAATLLGLEVGEVLRHDIPKGKPLLLWDQSRLRGGPRRTSSQARTTQITTITPGQVSAQYPRWPRPTMISQTTLRIATST